MLHSASLDARAPKMQSSFAVLRATASVLPLTLATLPTAFIVVLVAFETAGMTRVHPSRYMSCLGLADTACVPHQ
jgi:hypothetical protein